MRSGLTPTQLIKSVEKELDEIIQCLEDGAKKDEIVILELSWRLPWIKAMIRGKGFVVEGEKAAGEKVDAVARRIRTKREETKKK